MTHRFTLTGFGLTLVLLTLLLFATETVFLIPYIAMSLLGIVCIASGRMKFNSLPVRHLVILFALLWLPLCLSSIDAINPSRALEKTATYLLYLPAVLFMVYSLAAERAIRVLHTGIFVVLCLWIIDGTIQFVAGHDLFGYPYTPPQLKGMFFPKVRMPYFLAMLAPLFFEFIRIHYKQHKWLLLMIIPFGMMVLLGGKRTAWMMLLFSSAGYAVYFCLVHRTLRVSRVVAITTVLVLPLILLAVFHAPLKKRIDSTLAIFSTDSEHIDKATAHRLDLWRVAYAIGRDHWINGVGPRGFREVFAEYAERDNFWVRSGRPQGTTHPHLFLAEIFSETGLAGFSGYLVFYFLLLRLLWREIRQQRLDNVPWLLCPLTAWLPLNAHLAFYGSYWTSAAWWTLAVCIAVIHTGTHGARTDH